MPVFLFQVGFDVVRISFPVPVGIESDAKSYVPRSNSDDNGEEARLTMSNRPILDRMCPIAGSEVVISYVSKGATAPVIQLKRSSGRPGGGFGMAAFASKERRADDGIGVDTYDGSERRGAD